MVITRGTWLRKVKQGADLKEYVSLQRRQPAQFVYSYFCFIYKAIKHFFCHLFVTKVKKVLVFSRKHTIILTVMR